MSSLNKVILVGRVTRDPELRYSPNGLPIASFSLAVDRTRGKAGAEKETDFINIKAFQQTAEIAAKYAVKGKLVAIDGRLQVRNYETQDGQKRTAYEVVVDDLRLLSSGGNREGGGGYDGGGSRGYDSAPAREPSYAPPSAERGGTNSLGGNFDSHSSIPDDDIPF